MMLIYNFNTWLKFGHPHKSTMKCECTCQLTFQVLKQSNDEYQSQHNLCIIKAT